MQMPAATLDTAYAPAYAEWTELNKNVLHTWDSETRVQSFAAFVEADAEKRLLGIIETQNLDEEAKKERTTLAKRGQLLLVSTDEGKTFDKYLTPEETKTAPAIYTLYSPTLRASTNDLHEVVEEQTLINWVKRTEETYRELNKEGGSIWRVEDATLKDGKVHLEVARTARNAEDDDTRFALDIDVDQPANLPMVYDKSTAGGEKKKAVPETQLDTEFGMAEPDPSLQIPDQRSIEMTTAILGNDAAIKQAVQSQVTAGLSTWAALEAIDHVSKEQRAAQNAEMTRAIMERPLAEQMPNAPVQNVMAAKAAMKARFARQSEANQKSKQREAERIEKIKQADKFMRKLFKNEKNPKKPGMSVDQKKLVKNTGIVAAAAASAVTALAGSTMFVTHLTLFS